MTALMTATATAIAHPNIALVKYWGKRDLALNLPAVSSVSLTLDGFQTTTRVDWGAPADHLSLDGAPAQPREAAKVFALLDRLDPDRPRCAVTTANTFPTGAGLASSASGFAALTLAAATARARAHGDAAPPDLVALSRLARQGSGSACRSLWGGFVLWSRGEAPDGHDSHGVPLHDAHHWDVVMVVGVVSKAGKAVGSTEGMERSRLTSPLYDTWVAQAEEDVAAGIAAIADRDLTRLGEVMEASTLKMHAAMMTARPPLLYWQPATVAALHAVWALRAAGTSAWVTMDAGPQVKVLCARADAERVADAIRPHVLAVHVLGPGGPARIVDAAP
jgi:diphosphomevalonate decarboxylase